LRGWLGCGRVLCTLVDWKGREEGKWRRTFERAFGFAETEVARLLEGGERFVDACDGELVGLDVEVADCVVDELGGLVDA
jgi:ABC-type amino acid transport substrate-binding protein